MSGGVSRVDLAALEAALDKAVLSPTALRAFVDAAYDALPALIAIARAAERVAVMHDIEFGPVNRKPEHQDDWEVSVVALRVALDGLAEGQA